MSGISFLAPRRVLGLCIALELSCLCGVAAAQSDEQRAGARALATEGAGAFNEGRFKDAVDLFGRAESLMHAPPHLLFLARSHTKLGQFVKAREAYLKIIKEQLPASSPQAFRDAQSAAGDEIKGVEPHIGALTIKVDGSDNAKDLSVAVDGQPVSVVLLGVPQPMDPGTHRVTASATGWKATPVTVTLKDAERGNASLKLEPDASTAVAPLATTPTGPVNTAASAPLPGTTEPPSDSGASSGSNGMRIGSYVALGVGVVGLGMGTVFGLSSKSKRSDANAADAKLEPTCPCSADDPAAKNVASLDNSARSAMTLSIVGFAVGGVGIATGVTLFVLSGKHQEKAAARIEPWVGLGSAGLRGAF